MTGYRQIKLWCNTHQEAESLSNALAIMGSTNINQEGWPTSYGGTGITIWAKFPARYKRQVLADFCAVSETLKVIEYRKVEQHEN